MHQANHDHSTTASSTPRSFVWPLPLLPRQTPPDGERRGFFGFTRTALTAGLKAPIVTEPTDPTVDLYRRYRAIESEQELIEPRADIIRSCLTAKWGELPGAYLAWAEDPDSVELTRLTKLSDNCTERLCDLTDAMMVTPATTLAGLRAKLEIAIELWPTTEGELHEDVAIAFMHDAVRLLGGYADA